MALLLCRGSCPTEQQKLLVAFVPLILEAEDKKVQAEDKKVQAESKVPTCLLNVELKGTMSSI